MPEGPEIRRAADRLGEVLAGRAVERVEFAFPELKRWEKRLAGRRVETVDARGKAMLIRFTHGPVVYSHNQLYGRWMVRKAGELPETGRQLRLALHTRDRSALLYSASEIAVLRPEGLDDHPYLARLGPDVLAADLRPSRIAARLANRRFRARSLGALLLDQGFLAGLGNYLRSEILFVAGLHPDLRPVELDDAQRDALARAARVVSRRAYRQAGVTVPRAEFRRHRASGERRGQARFAVFGRDGRPCRRCGRKVKRVERASRRLYLCPGCQPAPSRSRRGARSRRGG